MIKIPSTNPNAVHEWIEEVSEDFSKVTYTLYGALTANTEIVLKPGESVVVMNPAVCTANFPLTIATNKLGLIFANFFQTNTTIQSLAGEAGSFDTGCIGYRSPRITMIRSSVASMIAFYCDIKGNILISERFEV